MLMTEARQDGVGQRLPERSTHDLGMLDGETQTYPLVCRDAMKEVVQVSLRRRRRPAHDLRAVWWQRTGEEFPLSGRQEAAQRIECRAQRSQRFSVLGERAKLSKAPEKIGIRGWFHTGN